ncbi:MAG: methyltransferase domain-containing protein [Ignavibacteria bacterium]
MSNSIEFNWDIEDFDNDLNVTDKDEGVSISVSYFKNNVNAIILEAGCGNGRVVKYLQNLGYSNIEGVELNSKIVKEVNSRFKDLNIYQGDLLIHPFKNDYYDFIISYGVIEHFKDGIDEPLKVFHNILKKDGVAILTVPAYNLYTKMRYMLSKIKPSNKERAKNIRGKDGNQFVVSPLYGDFFFYYLTPSEFKKLCQDAGFSIIEYKEISHEFGLYHALGKIVGNFSGNLVILNKFGKILNRILKLIPNCYNHMQLLVLKKV